MHKSVCIHNMRLVNDDMINVYLLYLAGSKSTCVSKVKQKGFNLSSSYRINTYPIHKEPALNQNAISQFPTIKIKNAFSFFMQ